MDYPQPHAPSWSTSLGISKRGGMAGTGLVLGGAPAPSDDGRSFW